MLIEAGLQLAALKSQPRDYGVNEISALLKSCAGLQIDSVLRRSGQGTACCQSPCERVSELAAHETDHSHGAQPFRHDTGANKRRALQLAVCKAREASHSPAFRRGTNSKERIDHIAALSNYLPTHVWMLVLEFGAMCLPWPFLAT